ncbi:MAG: ATP-binding cassette domain-containing protein [Candidatus Bathyarchaeia archaeon]
MRYAIETIEAAKKFGGFVLVSCPNLQFVYSEILGLTGSNGAGKTTVVRTMACLLKTASGILIDEYNAIEELEKAKQD